ncbi:MAG: hypothetical protein ACYTKD_21520 [Planctomycetota bacterium]
MTTRLAASLLTTAACLASCATRPPEAQPGSRAEEGAGAARASAPAAETLTPPTPASDSAKAPAMATWREAVRVALAKAEAGEQGYILDHMLAPELVERLAAKHGEAGWRRAFREGRLAQISYYLGYMKDADVETSGGRTVVRGEHGCFAVFVEVGGRMLIADFGQDVSSM